MDNYAYLGIDVGSTTAKFVIIDTNNNIRKTEYTKLHAKPVEVVLSTLAEKGILDFNIVSIGVTGSSRKLIGDLLQADIIKNEITAHTIGTVNTVRGVKTIIEIGGQDSKIIFLNNDDNNMLESFAMNKVCAAGTGSFLEWQAQRLGINLDEFNRLALKSTNPVKLTGKCAVFIESSIVKAQQCGYPIEDIAMGICDALVQNYIGELTVGKKLIGPIAFQGGVAKLECMAKSFERAINQDLIVPQNCEVIGAFGMACLAKDNIRKNRNNKNQQIVNINSRKLSYNTTVTPCSGCANHCQLQKVEYNGKFYVCGSKCGKY